jgi:hypothetical protein
MRKSQAYLVSALVVGAVALAAVAALVAWDRGGADSPSAPAAPRPSVCRRAELASWQKLADEIRAPVYCPSWLPSPLEGRFGGPFFNGRSVDPDRSYLVSFVWFESSGGTVYEVHVNLRGYPGSTRIPTCEDTLTVDGETVRRKIPCFSDRQRQRRFGNLSVTVYTANQGADMWHVLYAWRRAGTLYTLSEHVAPPYTYRQVTLHLNRMMRRLVPVRPQT